MHACGFPFTPGNHRWGKQHLKSCPQAGETSTPSSRPASSSSQDEPVSSMSPSPLPCFLRLRCTDHTVPCRAAANSFRGCDHGRPGLVFTPGMANEGGAGRHGHLVSEQLCTTRTQKKALVNLKQALIEPLDLPASCKQGLLGLPRIFSSETSYLKHGNHRWSIMS